MGALSSGASNLTGKGGLLSEQNLNKLTESEAKEVNDALTNAYAGMLENEGYRNVEEYRKQAEKTNANKTTAIAHALAVGTELAQMIKTQTQKAEKATAGKNVAKTISASQNEESANNNGEKTAAVWQEQTGKPSTFSEEQLKNMSVPQLKTILQSLAPAFAEKWKSAGLKAVEVDRQVAEMLGGNNRAQLARDIGTMQKELGTEGNGDISNQTIEAETQTQQDSAELLKGEEETGTIKDNQEGNSNQHYDVNTKPEYAPNQEKWLSNGGRITVDQNGVWTYHDWEGNSVKYSEGYPDFESSGLVIQKVSIESFENYNSDFRKADQLAPNGSKSIENTWHHHQDMTTMQEVNRDIHRRFTHKGGMSLSKKKKG